MRGLQIKARFKATIHLFWKGWEGKHKIWRLYSHLGFNTMRVFCECGEEFTTPLPGDPPVEFLIKQINDSREAMKRLRAAK